MLSRRSALTATLVQAAAVAACAVVLGLASPAAAATFTPSDELVAVIGQGGEGYTSGVVRIKDMVPGDDPSVSTLVVSQRLAPEADVAIAITDLDEQENSCVRPEQRMGDDCDSQVGELGTQATLTVRHATMDGDRCVATDTDPVVEDLDGVVLADLDDPRRLVRLADDERACFSLAWQLPDQRDNNLVMSDSVTFRIDVGAAGDDEDTAPGEDPDDPGDNPSDVPVDPTDGGNDGGPQTPPTSDTEVLGTKFPAAGGDPAGHESAGSQLPRTGGEIAGLVGAALISITIGYLLVARPARRKDSA